MHLFTFTSIASTFLYAILYDWRLLFIQSTIIFLYFLGAYLRSHGKTSVRKKIAQGSWGAPQDTSVYGTVEVDMDIVDNFIGSYNKKNPDNKITYTHFFMKLVANSMSKVPRINGTYAFGEFIPFEGIHMNTLVDIEGKNLTGVTVNNCEQLSFKEIRQNLNYKIKKIKMKKDEDTKEQMKIAKMLPSCVMACLLEFSSFITYTLGVSFKPLKLKKYPFGNIILTNASKTSIQHAYAPLVNFSRAILLVVLCSPYDKPVVNEKREVEVRKVMNVNMTFDHRYADAMTVQPVFEEFIRLVKNPELMLS
jgi:pyruvate/2-oxoglutarate dehydrogenase complex dihydrolipoamide acyltransferase (E2) component